MASASASTTVLRLASGAQVHALVRSAGFVKKCLLLHGNPGSLAKFEALLPHVAAVADVAALDMPGFGESRCTPGARDELTLNRLADWTVAAADALGWNERFFVVGHSHGGGVAQVVAARHPARVAGLVLLGTLGSPVHASYRALSAPGAAAALRAVGPLFRVPALRPCCRALVERFMRPIFAPEAVTRDELDEEVERFAERPDILMNMVELARGRPSAQLFANAASIRCPALFLHGERDALVPVRCARTIHRRIETAGGTSCFELVAGAGHLFIQFQAAEVGARVARFVAETGVR